MDGRRSSWMSPKMHPEVTLSGALTPPSSYAMHEGNDWNAQVEPLFGEQMQTVMPCGEPFNLDLEMAEPSIPPQIDGAVDVAIGGGWPNALGIYTEPIDPGANSHITLQDLLKSDEVEASYQYSDDPWLEVPGLGYPSINNGTDTQFLAGPGHSAQQSEASTNSPWTASRIHFRAPTESLTDTGESNEPCYARLLFNCLREAPEHTLSLKNIYTWIRQNTSRAKDPTNKGWQNSVRHNLSMNAAFERVPASDDGQTKKGSLWRLTHDAIRDGVISTTRYRRDPKRKAPRRGTPALKRQMSGAKGGAATRAASHARRVRECQTRSYQIHPAEHSYFRTPPDSTVVTPVTMHSAMFPHVQPQMVPSSPYWPQSNGWHLTPPPTQPHTRFCYQEPQETSENAFELQRLAGERLFGETDVERPYTPSLVTDNSYFTDNNSLPPSGGP